MTATRTLILLRHAKSDYPDGVADHDRPLAKRGIREAALAGDWIRENLPPVDAVLCSTATRTRQTLERTGITAPVKYIERLYDATAGIAIEVINGAPEAANTLLVIGHEPVMSSLALSLASLDTSDRDAAGQIALKYPTSAIAVLHTDRHWSQLELRSAELVEFHIPR
ncbi:histidine phosphatase family protein [Mycolicibacterium mucogenicum]|uniref:SixA phosphatase family protein n=1 Tax=Mycolicibacterium mucogenicum TaxID=56689 RepID=UPI00226987DB|nr:histidine phosphatase family protein [Mycolicibacterium mucogenicum]MCX8559364.1 histidine phosphatase family protein [Mycolicibacterium mucogenicum]